jgi:hypothetical protein
VLALFWPGELVKNNQGNAVRTPRSRLFATQD